MPTETLERRNIELDQRFSRVKISGAGRFTMVPGKRPSVSVVADGRIVDKAVVKVAGETLYVYTERDVYDLDKIFFEPIYEIVTENIVAIDVSGEIIGTLSAVGEKLRIVLSGLTNVEAENLIVARVDAELSGASRLKATGTTDCVVLDLSGSSVVNAMDLKASRGRVAVRGSAEANVFVTEHLAADTSAIGRVVYRGHPHVVQKRSGFGRIVADN